ncbi:MAG: hypothetical protein CVU56_09075 [Deltaproteobacteria bacterium HGW-Deltaproteobacteria-14]|jgi:hypothetical protein|nr:MAG: hypothetical protein CVU56_09075 [Deltaproteobacteria bacterium HGW-Deltaproteobacteria-14]
MIERVVLIKLSDQEANTAGRQKVVNHARRVLPTIPGVLSLTVGTPMDAESAKSWDVSIVVRLPEPSDVARFKEDPDRRAFFEQFLGVRTSIVKAWNFEVDEPAGY